MRDRQTVSGRQAEADTHRQAGRVNKQRQRQTEQI